MTEPTATGLVHNLETDPNCLRERFSWRTSTSRCSDGRYRYGLKSGETDFTIQFSTDQVTAGGILTKDFDPATLESRRVKGLYAAGEVLDIDGDCGGFNLQWAWASAFAAARAMAAGLWDCVKEKGRGI